MYKRQRYSYTAFVMRKEKGWNWLWLSLGYKRPVRLTTLIRLFNFVVPICQQSRAASSLLNWCHYSFQPNPSFCVGLLHYKVSSNETPGLLFICSCWCSLRYNKFNYPFEEIRAHKRTCTASVVYYTGIKHYHYTRISNSEGRETDLLCNDS